MPLTQNVLPKKCFSISILTLFPYKASAAAIQNNKLPENESLYEAGDILQAVSDKKNQPR